MIRRILKLNIDKNYFIFGARGTGKTTLLKELTENLSEDELLYINLLTDRDEDEYGLNPDNLTCVIDANNYKLIVIDEIQKFPKLLDVVHNEIEKDKNLKFILTGSSARKLKRGGANLMAGRARTKNLFPLSSFELKSLFNLDKILKYGALPTIYNECQDEEDIQDYLRSYCKTYLKEEILQEQIIRKIESFRDFLNVAAQSNGKIINYSKIAKDVGIDDKTVMSYFLILEETNIGMRLPSYHTSVRKRQRVAPKFYLFDLGVKRALENSLTLSLDKRTSEYGNAFEHFIFLELYYLNEYFKRDFEIFYLRTKDDAEIDFIIKRPGERDLLLEIKSTDKVDTRMATTLNHFVNDWHTSCEAQLWSTQTTKKKFNDVLSMNWFDGLRELFDIGENF